MHARPFAHARAADACPFGSVDPRGPSAAADAALAAASDALGTAVASLRVSVASLGVAAASLGTAAAVVTAWRLRAASRAAADARAAWRRRRRIAAGRRELQALDARMLADIGLDRGAIAGAARFGRGA